MHERRTSNRLRRALVGVGVLLVVTLVAGALAILAAGRANPRAGPCRAGREPRGCPSRRGAGTRARQSRDRTPACRRRSPRRRFRPGTGESRGSAHAGWSGDRRARRRRAVGRPGTAWMPSLAVSPDGEVVAGVVLSDGVRMFDATTLSPLPFAQVTPSSGSAAISPDGHRLAVAVNHLDEQPLRLYDLPRGTLSPSQPGGIPSGSGIPYTDKDRPEVSFSRDGRRMVAELRQSGPATRWSPVGTTMVWDLADLSEPVFSLRHGRSPSQR